MKKAATIKRVAVPAPAKKAVAQVKKAAPTKRTTGSSMASRQERVSGQKEDSGIKTRDVIKITRKILFPSTALTDAIVSAIKKK